MKTLNEAMHELNLKEYDRHNKAAEKYGGMVFMDGKEKYRPLWVNHREERDRFRKFLKGQF